MSYIVMTLGCRLTRIFRIKYVRIIRAENSEVRRDGCAAEIIIFALSRVAE